MSNSTEYKTSLIQKVKPKYYKIFDEEIKLNLEKILIKNNINLIGITSYMYDLILLKDGIAIFENNFAIGMKLKETNNKEINEKIKLIKQKIVIFFNDNYGTYLTGDEVKILGTEFFKHRCNIKVQHSMKTQNILNFKKLKLDFLIKHNLDV